MYTEADRNVRKKNHLYGRNPGWLAIGGSCLAGCVRWKQEWEAELCYREMLLADWDKLTWRTKLDLVRRSLGAFWDALLLQPRRLEDEVFCDLRFGLRMLLRQPGFTAAVMLTLALGIGANSAIFSLVNAVLLELLPYAQPNQLMMVWESNEELARNHESPSPGNFLDLRDQGALFESLTTWFVTARALQGDLDAEQVNSALVSPEFFHTLGAQAALGRVFQPGEISGVVFMSRQYRAATADRDQ